MVSLYGYVFFLSVGPGGYVLRCICFFFFLTWILFFVLWHSSFLFFFWDPTILGFFNIPVNSRI